MQDSRLKQSANITHLWYRGWPEFFVPNELEEIAAFDQMANMLIEFACNDDLTGKFLIHCRAGIGRSGTLLTVVSQFYMLNKHPERILPLENTLNFLRRQRRSLVESTEQYIFI